MENDPAPDLKRIYASQGRAITLIAPVLVFSSVLMTWWLMRSPFSTLAEEYLTSIIIGLAAFASLIILLLVRFTLVPYLRMRHELYDLLARKEREKDRYEYVLLGSGEGYWDYDVVQKKVFISGALMSMLGYANRDQIVTFDMWIEQFPENEREGVVRTFDSLLDKRIPEISVEHRIRRSNGEYVWIEDKAKAFWDEKGNPTRVSGVSVDIGNIKRVQEVLESRTNELEVAKTKIEMEIQNVKKFQKAVDTSVEAVSITTPDGAIIYVNQAWAMLNGYTDTEVIGRNHHILKSEKTKPETIQALWEKIASGNIFTSEDIFNKRKDGSEYQASISIYPIRENGETRFYVAVCQDITLRKEIDRAKTEFVSLASHQLRTPLSAIRWYSEMLMSKYVGELNEKQRQYVKEIYQGNLRMVDLVNALLNVSRIDLGTFAIEPEPVNLVEICDSVISELVPQITEKKQTVNRIYTNAPQTYLADSKLIRIVFQNFLSNSVKYTQEGGHIVAEIGQNEGMLYIRVTDDGYGIPKSQQSKIFEKLFRADNVRQKDTEGTGLGMYIVKAIVESCSGRIWFESEENKGTTFHVLLPLSGMPKKTGAKGLS